jgi:hypothetical protein
MPRYFPGEKERIVMSEAPPLKKALGFAGLRKPDRNRSIGHTSSYRGEDSLGGKARTESDLFEGFPVFGKHG